MDAGRQVIEGEIASYWIDDGILVSDSKSVLRTVDNIRRNVELVKQITGGRRMPLLIFLKPSPMPDKATRTLSAELVPTVYSAMAMVSRPGLGQLVMRLVFSLQRPPIPMKSFSDEAAARAWLRSLPGAPP